MGARFAKWRAVITIGDGIPSRGCIEANAQALARYAALCQEAGLVPIVEPEVLMEGEHDLERCFDVTDKVLRTVFTQLYAQRVMLEGMILKPTWCFRDRPAPSKKRWTKWPTPPSGVSCGPCPLPFRGLRFCRGANPPNWPRPD